MTHAQLENPGDLFATAAKAILQADTPAWPVAVYAHREGGIANLPRTDVRAFGFDRASDHMDWANISGNATPFYNHRRGRLAFDVWTPVAYRTQAANANIHANCVGRIGYLCDRVTQKFIPSALSGLIVLDIVDQGTATLDTDQKSDMDKTTRDFEIEYIIPGAVYAAAT